MKRIVVFASGSGSNAENLISFFNKTEHSKVVLVLTNNPKAKVIERCKRLKVPCISFNRSSFYDTSTIKSILKGVQTDLIILAGFLWKFPESILNDYPNRVINVHPALLPKFGGKGMYGMNVHEAVIANNETESGITIHYVNENYDEGAIIFQGKCQLSSTDTASDLASKIHELEMEHFPKIINQLLTDV